MYLESTSKPLHKLPKRSRFHIHLSFKPLENFCNQNFNCPINPKSLVLQYPPKTFVFLYLDQFISFKTET